MPILDSFKVNHKLMKAPAVRLAKRIKTKKGDIISVFDLRFVKPNTEMLPPKGMHTFEHYFANLMRVHLNGPEIVIIDISPMGCRTGFYMSLIGTPTPEKVAEAFTAACSDIARLNPSSEIPEANEYQCGSGSYHSVPEAIAIAEHIVKEGVSINRNEDILLTESELKALKERNLK